MVARPIKSPYSGFIGEFYMAGRKNYITEDFSSKI